jgi:hypothetical protein
MLRHELIFREPEPFTATETALEDEAGESHGIHQGDLTWNDSVLADNE